MRTLASAPSCWSAFDCAATGRLHFQAQAGAGCFQRYLRDMSQRFNGRQLSSLIDLVGTYFQSGPFNNVVLILTNQALSNQQLAAGVRQAAFDFCLMMNNQARISDLIDQLKQQNPNRSLHTALERLEAGWVTPPGTIIDLLKIRLTRERSNHAIHQSRQPAAQSDPAWIAGRRLRRDFRVRAARFREELFKGIHPLCRREAGQDLQGRRRRHAHSPIDHRSRSRSSFKWIKASSSCC